MDIADTDLRSYGKTIRSQFSCVVATEASPFDNLVRRRTSHSSFPPRRPDFIYNARTLTLPSFSSSIFAVRHQITSVEKLLRNNASAKNQSTKNI